MMHIGDMTRYIALIHKDANSDFGVSFPDFPGCITAGETLDEAASMAQEALALHIEGLQEDGEVIPEPSPMAAVEDLPESEGAVFMLVPAPAQAARNVRINITLPDTVLQRIDRYAKQHGYSRSGFLVEASRRFLEDA